MVEDVLKQRAQVRPDRHSMKAAKPLISFGF